jgi:hypothetical protein
LPKSLPAAYEMMPPQQTETFQMREKETTNKREIRSPIKKKTTNIRSCELSIDIEATGVIETREQVH